MIRLVDELLRGVDAAERHASAQVASANGRLARGTLLAIATVGLLLAAFLLIARRIRRRGDERFRALVEQSSEIRSCSTPRGAWST